MNTRFTRLAIVLGAFFIAVFSKSLVAEEKLSAEQVKFFETKIRPVLIKECYGCHSNQAGNAKGGLRLDTQQLTWIGGSSGPAVVPGDLEESLLFNAINHEDWVMPPKRKLPDSVIADFKTWIEMGAPDPRVTKVGEIRSTISAEDIEQARAEFWAYKRPEMTGIPAVNQSQWPKSPVDNYILARLESEKITPAQDATANRFLRRLCFDLVGLPPSPEQVAYFESAWKTDPDRAVAKVVDQLLNTKQFGERWGRHWLDVARYGESTGREVNMTYPHAWRYRDYVIDSFNDDKPFDQFVREQIAGDLLPAEDDAEWAENLVATGFLAIGTKSLNERNTVQFRSDLVDEQIDTTTRVFLGTSVACARCHDHKFDAIPQSDYYALAGIFASTETYFGNPPSEYGDFKNLQARQSTSLLLLPIDDPNPFDTSYSPRELADLKKEMDDKLEEAAQARRDRSTASGQNAIRQRIQINNQLAALSAKLAIVDDRGQPKSYCMGVQDSDAANDVNLLVRGEIDQRGPIVPRGFPQVLDGEDREFSKASSGRLELAEWMSSDDNPLTARVMVNRIWQTLIGQGIVSTTENFGVTGEAPSHPQLLDYLAVHFVESGWSVKSVIREIANSRTYRMSTNFDQTYFEVDPDNKLVWRANARRLDAESLRDAMLMISGDIDLQRPRASEVAKAGYVPVRDGVLGNPQDLVASVREQVAKRAEEMRSGNARFANSLRGRFRNRGESQRPDYRSQMQSAFQEIMQKVQNRLDMEDATYRSVYLPIVRNEIPRSLDVFDFAESSLVVGKRESSNTSNQALYLMNNPFVIAQSEALAKRLNGFGRDTNTQIEKAFVLVYGRSPTDDERYAAANFVKSFPVEGDRRNGQSVKIAALCQSLFASAEFRYID